MKQNLVGKMLGKIKISVQDFVTIKTGIKIRLHIFLESSAGGRFLSFSQRKKLCTGTSKNPEHPPHRRVEKMRFLGGGDIDCYSIHYDCNAWSHI